MSRYYLGLDVALRTTAICVVDESGATIHEAEVATDAAAIAAEVRAYRRTLAHVAHEAGPGSTALHKALVRERLPVVCWDARKTRAALRAQRNKTDRNDARDIARLLARGFDASVHIKSDEANRWRALWTFRSALNHKALDLARTLRAVVRTHGASLQWRGDEVEIKWPRGTKDRSLQSLAAPLLRAHHAIAAEAEVLTCAIENRAKKDAVCMRLMTVPGVGPLVAASYRAAIDDPHRFEKSSLVGAYLGLTPRRYQSGTTNISGAISRFGSSDVRACLYLAAQSLLLRSKSNCALKTWGLKLRKRKGAKIANVAVARKLAVVLHRMWVTETDFQDHASIVKPKARGRRVEKPKSIGFVSPRRRRKD